MSASPASSSIRPWFDWAQSAVNGLWGDALHAEGNGLAIRMGFHDHGRPMPLDRAMLAQMEPAATGRLCILVHGLGCNEGAWRFGHAPAPEPETTYAHLLQAELDYTPFLLRYNTGLSIAENGLAFAALMQALLDHYPVRVEEIVLVGHSMGGLVLRCACHDAVLAHMEWVRRVTRIFYLGTPHEGADLERLAHAASTVLAAVPNPVTRLVGRILDLRSQGVRDLRYGSRTAPHHAAAASDDHHPAEPAVPQPIPWLATARHCFVSGVFTQNPANFAGAVLGDGLVRPISHKSIERARSGSETDQPLDTVSKVLPGAHHLSLMRDARVYAFIRDCCSEE